MNDASAWEKEYQNKGIPSSYETEPSRTVMAFVQFLKNKGISGKVLDVGCGKGRNSVYLQQQGFTPVCLDFLESNIEYVKKTFEFEGYCQSVTDRWPFQPESFDGVIDVFCYKHIIDPLMRLRYRDFLKRALKSGGYYMLALSDITDGYYGELLQQKPHPNNVVVDPANGIASVLFTEKDIKREFADFTIVEAKLKTNPGTMHGEEHLRRLWYFVMRKN